MQFSKQTFEQGKDVAFIYKGNPYNFINRKGDEYIGVIRDDIPKLVAWVVKATKTALHIHYYPILFSKRLTNKILYTEMKEVTNG